MLKSRPPPLALPPLLCIKRRSCSGTSRVEERFQELRARCAGGNTRSLRRTARGPRHSARARFRPTCSVVPRRRPLCQCVSANVLLRCRGYRCAHASAALRALGVCRHHRRPTRRHVASNLASVTPLTNHDNHYLYSLIFASTALRKSESTPHATRLSLQLPGSSLSYELAPAHAVVCCCVISFMAFWLAATRYLDLWTLESARRKA